MTIYWILLALPALMALLYPVRDARGFTSAPQVLALYAFAGLYVGMSLLRDEIGSDWYAYQNMYEQVSGASLAEALTVTDFGFALLLWVSSLFDLGIFPVNAIASLLLVIGVIRVAATTRDPWLAITFSVPYLLIVLGFGYVRQAAAIGMILMAIASIERSRIVSTGFRLLIAISLHSTSVIVLPFFAYALADRNKLRVLLITTLGGVAFVVLIASQLSVFSESYLEAEYSSRGAAVRIAMGLLPAILLLWQRKIFESGPRARSLWLGFALANIGLIIALTISPSSTVVDRIGLYFAAIQVLVFGEIGRLTRASARTVLVVRFLVISLAVAVQMVWLLFAEHAGDWVPYESIAKYL